MKVQLLDKMGSDLTVVNSARVSFDKHSDVVSEKDAKLIKYLAKHGHWSPFAHCFAQFRISAPIFVARQLAKHQVGLSWNEVSRRYVSSEPDFYLPKKFRQSTDDKKQGSSDREVANPEAVKKAVVECYAWALNAYEELMAVDNVCEEQARMVLPLGVETEWIWSGSLYAFSRVCIQRLKPDAQEETREVVQLIANELSMEFPESWVALVLEGDEDDAD